MRYGKTVKAIIYHFQEILEIKKTLFSFHFLFKVVLKILVRV